MSSNISSEASAIGGRTATTRPDVTALPRRSPGELERFLDHVARLDGEEPRGLRAWLDLAEAWKIRSALRACDGNRSAAARYLGIGRRTLYAKMEKLQITPSWGVTDQDA